MSMKILRNAVKEIVIPQLEADSYDLEYNVDSLTFTITSKGDDIDVVAFGRVGQISEDDGTRIPTFSVTFGPAHPVIAAHAKEARANENKRMLKAMRERLGDELPGLTVKTLRKIIRVYNRFETKRQDDEAAETLE